eukprot:2972880-Amphidinium_carterae.1
MALSSSFPSSSFSSASVCARSLAKMLLPLKWVRVLVGESVGGLHDDVAPSTTRCVGGLRIL